MLISAGTVHRVALLGVVLAVVAAVVAAVSGRLPAAQAAVSPGLPQRVSVADERSQLDRGGDQPAISADGRYVAFVTNTPIDPVDAMNDMSPSPSNSCCSTSSPGPVEPGDSDVYVRDLVTHRTTLITAGYADGESDRQRVPADGDSVHPSISADGRFIAFHTTASNLTYSEEEDGQVVICDRGQGFNTPTVPPGPAPCEFTRIGSVDFSDSQPDLAANASAVVWVAAERRKVVVTTLVPGTGQPARHRTVRPHLDGFTLRGESEPRLSGDGRRLVVTAQYSRPVHNSVVAEQFSTVMGVDLTAPAPPEGQDDPAIRLDVDENGRFVGGSGFRAEQPAISTDGRVVAYTGGRLVYTLDWPTGPGPLRAELVSRDIDDKPVSGMSPSLSGDGRYLAFVTDAGNVHNGVDDLTRRTSCLFEPVTLRALPAVRARATRSHCDVVVRDLVEYRAARTPPRPRAELVSPSTANTCSTSLRDATCEGNGESETPAMAADGRSVAYSSDATHLVPGDTDTNEVRDVFVRRFTPGLSAEPVDFGSVAIGRDDTRTATVRHTGFGPLTINSTSVTGKDAADYAIGADTCTRATLHAADMCLVSERFTPAACGQRQGTLTVVHDGVSNPLSVPLHGIAPCTPSPTPSPTVPITTVPITTVTPTPITPTIPLTSVPLTPVPPITPLPPGVPGLRATPDPLDLGERLVGTTSPPNTVTVGNSGSAPLTVGRIGLDPAAQLFGLDYAIVADGCTGRPVPPGGACQVTIVHTPRGAGPRLGVLRLDADTPGGPFLVALRGAGTVPAIQVNPAVGRPGQVTLVTGQGFPPGAAVTVRLRGFPESVQATASDTGSFGIPLLVFPRGEPGQRTVEASAVGLDVVPVTNLLVVPSTVQPPDFALRG